MKRYVQFVDTQAVWLVRQSIAFLESTDLPFSGRKALG